MNEKPNLTAAQIKLLKTAGEATGIVEVPFGSYEAETAKILCQFGYLIRFGLPLYEDCKYILTRAGRAAVS